MRCALRFITLSLAALLTLSSSPAASAQDTPKVDIFGGYSYVHANIVVSGTSINLNGASGSLAYNFNDWLGVVGDVGVYHQGSITANDLSLTVSTYQVGPRVSLRKRRHLTPFGQVLLGAGHAGGTLYTSSLGAGLAPLGKSNGFVLTAGGGVDWKLNHTIGIRLLQVEYVYSRFDNGANHGNQQNNVRLSTGIVLSFGSR